MKKIIGLIPILAMLALILDNKTATEGAAAGVALVLKTAIPALFPFFVLSAMILPACTKLSCPPLAKLLGTPPGWESVFLLGCVGGNLLFLYGFSLPLGNIFLGLYGIGAGVFTGCLAAALAEVVNMMPVLSERIHLKKGLAGIMAMFALGKLAGSLFGLLK